jgi:hypothetical protein
MAWIEKICKEAACGMISGVAQQFFDISLFSPDEVVEIGALKDLGLSIMEKSKGILVTDPSICKGIINRSLPALQTFRDSAPSKLVSAGAAVVCHKAFKDRFAKVLMGACLNLTGC